MALAFKDPDSEMSHELRDRILDVFVAQYTWYDTPTGRWMCGNGPNPYENPTPVVWLTKES